MGFLWYSLRKNPGWGGFYSKGEADRIRGFAQGAINGKRNIVGMFNEIWYIKCEVPLSEYFLLLCIVL